MAKRWSVYLRNDGNYRLVQYQDIDDINAWIGLVSIRNWKQKHMGRKS